MECWGGGLLILFHAILSDLGGSRGGMHERWGLLNDGDLAMEVMDCDRLVTGDRWVGIVEMVVTVGELGVTGVWFGMKGWGGGY